MAKKTTAWKHKCVYFILILLAFILVISIRIHSLIEDDIPAQITLEFEGKEEPQPIIPTSFTTTKALNLDSNLLIDKQLGAHQISFQMTCSSFPDQCKILNIPHSSNNNILCSVLMESCKKAMNNSDFPFDSPLFYNSFRRDFMMNYQDDKNSSCWNDMMEIFVNTYNKLKYSRGIFYHTHISKTAGTSILETFDKINKEKYNDTYTVLPSGKTPRGYFTFEDTIKPDLGAIISCEWLLRQKRLKDNAIFMEKENPLNNHKLCPQFVNSIVIRSPIEQRISLLIFILAQEIRRNGKLLCKQNASIEDKARRPPKHWVSYKNKTYVGCDTMEYIDGFLTDLFQFYDDPQIEVERLKHHSSVELFSNYIIRKHKNMNRSSIMEWIGDRDKNGEIIFEGSRYGLWFNAWNYRMYPHSSLNVSQYQGWLNNIYVRWLGFNHTNNSINLDAIYRNGKYINDKVLNEAKRILIQYDFILLFEKKNKVYLPNHGDNIIWKWLLFEFQRLIEYRSNKNHENKTKEITMKNMEYKEYIHSMSYESVFRYKGRLKADEYRNLIYANGEIDILNKYNKLDFELYEFAKSIHQCDKEFFQYLLKQS